MESTKYKHLTLEEKEQIEDLLNERTSAKNLSVILGKDPTTLSKEIKRRRIEVFNCYGRSKAYLDQLKPCPLLSRYPHVCNGCLHKRGCRLVKHYYRASAAHQAYLIELKESREGINASVNDIRLLEERIGSYVKNGQSFKYF